MLADYAAKSRRNAPTRPVRERSCGLQRWISEPVNVSKCRRSIYKINLAGVIAPGVTGRPGFDGLRAASARRLARARWTTRLIGTGLRVLIGLLFRHVLLGMLFGFLDRRVRSRRVRFSSVAA
jgi:hypothetical protein